MNRFGMKTVAALFLLVLATVIVACNNSPEPTLTPTNNTPTPTGTTPTPGPDATPTPEPVTTGGVLADARAALAEVESLRFAFMLTGPTRTLQGNGAWASGDYALSVESEACPPAMEGIPDPEDCAFVPLYGAAKTNGALYTHGIDGMWEAAGTPGSGWAIGPWSENFDVQQFNVPVGDGPSAMAQVVLDLAGSASGVEMAEESLDGTPVYRITAQEGDSTFELFIERDGYRVLQAVLTMHPENPTVWTWTFSDYGEEITIEEPSVE